MGPRVAGDPTAQQTPTSTRWVWAGGSPANGGTEAGLSRWNAGFGAHHWLADDEDAVHGSSSGAHSAPQLAGDTTDGGGDEASPSWRRAVDKARRWLMGLEDAPASGSSARSASWLEDPAVEGLSLLQLDGGRARGVADGDDGGVDGSSPAHHAPRLAGGQKDEGGPRPATSRAGWLAGGAEEEDAAMLWTADEDRAIIAMLNADEACIVAFDGAFSTPEGGNCHVTGAGVVVLEAGERRSDGWETGALQAQVASGLPEQSPATNNVAEGGACLHALLLIKEASQRRLNAGKEPLTVDLRGDSTLAVAWVTGLGSCDKQHLQPYFKAVRDATRRCAQLGTTVVARHVFRRFNGAADDASRVGQTVACTPHLMAAFQAEVPQAPAERAYLTSNQMLRKYNLCVREAGGGGDCQFASVAYALHRRVSSDLTYRMRQLACEELVRNASRYVGLVAPEEDLDEDEAMRGAALNGYPDSYRRFVAGMAERGEWGDGVTLAALSRALRRVIVILMRGSEVSLGCTVIHGGWSHEELTPESQRAQLAEATEAPLALWYTGQHYQAVVGKREAIEAATSQALFERNKPPVAIHPKKAPKGEKLNRRLQELVAVPERKDPEVRTSLVPEQWTAPILTHTAASASSEAAVVLCQDESEASSLRSANAKATAVLQAKPGTLPATRTEGTLLLRERGTAQATAKDVTWQVGPDAFKREPETTQTARRVILYATLSVGAKTTEATAQAMREAVWSAGGRAMGRGKRRGAVVEMRWEVAPSTVKCLLNRSGTAAVVGGARFPTVRTTFEEAHKWRMSTAWLKEDSTWDDAEEERRKVDDFAGFAMRGKVLGVRSWVDVNNPGPQTYRVSGVGGLSNEEVVGKLSAAGWQTEVSKRTSSAIVVKAAAAPTHTRLVVEKEAAKQWVTVQPLDESGGLSIRPPQPQSWASRVRNGIKSKRSTAEETVSTTKTKTKTKSKEDKGKTARRENTVLVPPPSSEAPPAWAASLLQQMQDVKASVAGVSARLCKLEEAESESSSSSSPAFPPPEESDDGDYGMEEERESDSDATRILRAENKELRETVNKLQKMMESLMEQNAGPAASQRHPSVARSPSPIAPLSRLPSRSMARSVSFAPTDQKRQPPPEQQQQEWKRGVSRKASETRDDGDRGESAEREKRQKQRDSLSPKKTQ